MTHSEPDSVISELTHENTELRKLVHDFSRYRFGDCEHCGYNEQCRTRQTTCYRVLIDLLSRAKALGIETD